MAQRKVFLNQTGKLALKTPQNSQGGNEVHLQLPLTFNYLLAGGGGGGGAATTTGYGGIGGGAGSSILTGSTTFEAGTYNITIGAGGDVDTDGGTTSLDSLSIVGGEMGDHSNYYHDGGDNEDYVGGDGFNSGDKQSAGGGGASSIMNGYYASSGEGGDGPNGKNISGDVLWGKTSTFIIGSGGGGGGYQDDGTTGLGGYGAGNGSNSGGGSLGYATDAVANSNTCANGGGGGGSYDNYNIKDAGKGSRGIVIISYDGTQRATITGSDVSTWEANGKTYHEFRSNGTLII